MYWRFKHMFKLLKLVIINKVAFVFEQIPSIGPCHVSCPVNSF